VAARAIYPFPPPYYKCIPLTYLTCVFNNSWFDLKILFAGTYTCVARTQAGTATDSGTLTVAGIPPTLIAGPTQMTIPEGADINALCSVTGLPLPRHTWFKVKRDMKVLL
jgi:hypothetical protein